MKKLKVWRHTIFTPPSPLSQTVTLSQTPSPPPWSVTYFMDGPTDVAQVFTFIVSEEMSPYIHGDGHFEFYSRWPPEIDHNLFVMVFEILMPIPATMPNLKNLAPSARSIWIPPPLEFLMQRVSVVVQRGNAACVLGTTSDNNNRGFILHSLISLI